MNERIEEIRRREENATRGPWTWDGHRVPTLSGRAGDPDIYEYDTEVIEASHHGECGCRSACTLELEVGPGDRSFIANAREDIPFLLAEVERLEREKALVRQAYEEKIGYLAKETRRASDMQLLAEKFASQEAEAHTRAEEAMQKVAEAWDEGRHFGQINDHAYPNDNPYRTAQ